MFSIIKGKISGLFRGRPQSPEPQQATEEDRRLSNEVFSSSGTQPRKAGLQGEKIRGPDRSLMRQVVAMLGMSVSCLLDGTVIAYTAPAIPSLLHNSSAVFIDDIAVSWIGSVHQLGAVLGCFLSIPTMSLLGRRGATLYPMSLAYLVSYMLIGTAINVEMIIIGRVFGGIGMGLTFSITSVYLMDISSPSYRGILGVFPPLLTQLGLLVTFVGGMLLDWWQLALLLLALVPPAQLIFWLLPESPSYLAARGRLVAMETALRRLGRSHEATRPHFLNLLARSSDIESMKTKSSKARGACCSWLPTCRQRRVWQPLLISLALMFFSQATGFNTVLGYAKLIFIEAHLGIIHEDEAMGITAGILLLSCGLAIWLSKIAPRRVLLLVSAVACCLTLALLGLYYYLKQLIDIESFTWLPLAALAALIVSHMCGYGAVGWTVIVELLPGSLRSRLFPGVVAFNCICNFAFAISFSRLENWAGYHVVFWLHAALTFVGAVVIFFFVPETGDKTEEEIAEIFTCDTSSELSYRSSSDRVVKESFSKSSYRNSSASDSCYGSFGEDRIDCSTSMQGSKFSFDPSSVEEDNSQDAVKRKSEASTSLDNSSVDDNDDASKRKGGISISFDNTTLVDNDDASKRKGGISISMDNTSLVDNDFASKRKGGISISMDNTSLVDNDDASKRKGGISISMDNTTLVDNDDARKGKRDASTFMNCSKVEEPTSNDDELKQGC